MRSPRPNTARPRRRRAVEQAFEQLLAALGHEAKGELARTPRRAAELWLEKLTRGERLDPRAILRSAVCDGEFHAPVSVVNLGAYLVCPHHLTVAFGYAHLAYAPRGKIVGFGALSELVEACTARLALQEHATVAIAQMLVEVLDARAAVASIEATHPCHNLLHARSHAAEAVTWAQVGEPDAARELRDLLVHAPRRRDPTP